MRLLLITIAFLLFGMHAATGSTYYVALNGDDASGDGSSGKPWRTLRAAVGKVAANQGHVIKILAGTFVESGYILVPTGVSIEGAGIGVTILKPTASLYYKSNAWLFDKFLLNLTGGGQGNQSVKALTIDGDSKQLYGGIVVKDRNNVLIQNVSVQYTYYTGIWMWNTVSCRVTQSKLKDCAWGSSGGASGSLIISLSESLEIDHMDIDENYGQAVDAISAGRMYYLKMHDNKFSVSPTGNWQTPGGVTVPNIAVEFYNVELKGCQVYNNYFDNNFSIAMDESKFATPTGVQTIRVYGNTFDLVTRAKGSGHCIELTLHDAEVDHNYFYGGSTGIANWDASANSHTMHNWSIHHNVFYGISSYYPSAVINMYRNGIVNAHIYNNTVETNGTATVNVLEVNNSGIADNVKLENNLIIDSNTSYQWYPNKFISLVNGATMRNGVARNNFFQKMTIGSVSGVTYSANLSGDPKIQKSGTRPSYYELLSGSPLIDKGINIGSYSGSATDIGAFEFSAETTTAPPPITSISITSPANNSSFKEGATINITANASTSSGSITKVEFYNGTIKLGEDASSPFAFSWTNATAGTHQITAHAITGNGQTAYSSAITVNIISGNTIPSVSITSPANNAGFSEGATIPISVFATDPDGQITKVEFFNGTTKLGEDTSSPHAFNWINVQAGTYYLSAKTTDNLGAVGTSASVTITVAPKSGNLSPTAVITSPGNNATFSAGITIPIKVTATDSDGQIMKVEFFSGTTKIGGDVSSPYGFNWNNAQAGTHQLTVKATDNLGATATSSTITVVVKTNLAPTVSITSPANNASFASGSTIPISVFATDKDGQIVKVMFFNGSTKLGEDLSSPHNFNWTNVPAGTYQLTARTIDNVGAIGISPAITVVVNAATNGRISSESNENEEVNESDLTLNATSDERARIFSPNNDGINDTWIWHTKEQHCICSIVIYDRAGRAVFQNDGVQHNWNGTFNGNSLPEDIYYYETNIEGVKKSGIVRIIK